MKRLISVCLFAITAAHVLTSCSYLSLSKAKRQINLIGEVTLESENDILMAKYAIDELSEEEKKKLDNLDIFEEACEKYDYLLLDEKSKATEDKITEIGEVEESDADLIKEARAMYSKLPKNVKALVNNIEELEKAEIMILALPIEKAIADIGSPVPESEKYEKAKLAYEKADEKVKKFVSNADVLTQAKIYLDSQEAQTVIDKINAIPALDKIVVGDRTQILMARVSYETLSEDCKQYVDNLEVLEQAEKRIEELLKQNSEETIAKLSDKFTKKYDEAQKVTWYISKSQPAYINERSYIFPYIGRFDSGNYSSLRLIVSYTGKSYINFDEIKVVTDGVEHYIQFEESKIKRSSKYGDYCETADILTKSKEENTLRDIANAKEAVVTFIGEDKNIDITISESDKKAIKEALDFYDALTSSHSLEHTLDVNLMKNAIDVIS